MSTEPRPGLLPLLLLLLKLPAGETGACVSKEPQSSYYGMSSPIRLMWCA